MIARNVKILDMYKALEHVNKQYDDNVEFENIVSKGRGVSFRLRVKSSRGPGHRRGFTGRRLINACWHVHGNFFAWLLEVNPEAKVVSRGMANKIIDRYGGNWQDRNIGSVMVPLMFSEACDCNGDYRGS